MSDFLKFNDNQVIAGQAQELTDLQKALNPGGAQYATQTPSNFTQGNIFMMESLEPVLKIVTEIEKHVKLWNMIDKSKAYQLVEQFDMQTKVGGMGSAWIEESDDAPREEDAEYSRELETVKYMGVKKRVHHIMTQIQSAHGDLITKVTKDGTVYLLRELERALFQGNGLYSNAGAFDGMVSHSDSYAFNGLDKQLRNGFNNTKRKMKDFAGYGDTLSHVIDQDNSSLDPETIEEVSRIAIEDNGSPDRILLSPKAHSDFSRKFYPKERFNDGKGNIIPGTVVPAVNTSLGKIDLINSRFLVPKQKVRTSAAADNTLCCNVPVSVTAVDTNAANTDLAAGDYIYQVCSVNKNGESMPAVSIAITAVAGDRIQIQIADPAGGTTPYAFAVYRSDVNAAATTCKFVGYVKRAGATTNFIDLNNKKPGTSQAYLLQMDSDTMSFRQLTPLFKMDLPSLGLYYHWLQVIYGTPIIFKPNFNCMIENISE